MNNLFLIILLNFAKHYLRDVTLADQATKQQYLNFVEKEITQSDARNKDCKANLKTIILYQFPLHLMLTFHLVQNCCMLSKSEKNATVSENVSESVILLDPPSVDDFETLDTLPIGTKYPKYRIHRSIEHEYPTSYGFILACLCEFVGATPEAFEKNVKELEQELEFWQPLS
jgi:hypothetical protein